MTTCHCAIYTRKSSEEGLDQEFNSLDAQRESCEAYIKSQAHEGWKLVCKHYDDGGFSGGNIERPALQSLLKDIAENRVDVVVVYKVDRLTRSLSDFAKIVDVFDAAGASFVAVTQHFNTTTSMGRLTLNVLLSFSQFEREVTGERIRDKIAASKKKGMWMGGAVPLGYDVKDKKLIVNEEEATRVRLIFDLYSELRSVTTLKQELDRKGLRSKSGISRAGQPIGGNPFTSGPLYRILQNRLYLGKIEHKENVYAGEHEAIVSQEVWDRVQEIVAQNRRKQRGTISAVTPPLLRGKVCDDRGNPMSPTHSVKKGERRYWYYVSRATFAGRKETPGSLKRVPADLLENLVKDRIAIWSGCSGIGTELSREEATSLVETWVERITVGEDGVEIELKIGLDELDAIRQRAAAREQDVLRIAGSKILFSISVWMRKRGGKRIATAPDGKALVSSPRMDEAMLRAIVRARKWRRSLISGEISSIQALADQEGCTNGYIRMILPIAYLAPDITEAVLDGHQPATLLLDKLISSKLPLAWAEQRRHLGFVV